MNTTVMQWMAAAVAMGAVLATGFPASANEAGRAASQAASNPERVALPRVLRADPADLDSRVAPVPAGLPANSAAVTVGPRALAGEPDAAQAGLTLEGIILPRVLRADPARVDSRGVQATAGLLVRADADDRAARDRDARERKLQLATLVGAGIGGTMGALAGASWCYNEGGGSCPLTFNFGALGALIGGGIGWGLGALDGR